jgi:hypothetical protein
VRLSVDKMKKLGWKSKHTSDEAVRRAIISMIEEIVGSERVCR